MDAAIITLDGTRVGQLTRLSEDFDFRFDFDPDYVTRPRRPTLGQLFEDRLPDPIVTSGLMCWFAHLLPQGPSRELFQKWHRLDREDDDDFDLLLAIGTDLPGAVVMHPAEGDVRSATTRRRPAPRPNGGPSFSLAGAQSKLSVRRGARGLVVPTWGEDGHYIAKFHDPQFAGLPCLEHATTEWARDSGVDCHETQLVTAEAFEALPEGLPTGDGTVLLITRFDRQDDRKIHVEDFGQVLDVPPGHPEQYSRSYDELGLVLRTLSPGDIEEFIRRVAFMMVCGNGDAHLKNWGVIYRDTRTPTLSPAYDLIATICRISSDDLALKLAGTKRWDELTPDRIRAFLAVCHEDHQEAAVWFHRAIDRAVGSFRSGAKGFGFTEAEVAALETHIAMILRVVGRQ